MADAPSAGDVKDPAIHAATAAGVKGAAVARDLEAADLAKDRDQIHFGDQASRANDGQRSDERTLPPTGALGLRT